MRQFYISHALLQARGACRYQRKLFVRTFGYKKVLFNARNWERARYAGLELGWIAHRVAGYNAWNNALESVVFWERYDEHGRMATALSDAFFNIMVAKFKRGRHVPARDY